MIPVYLDHDLQCAGVSEKRYLNTLTGERRQLWKCATRVSKVPKKDNSNTPVRAAENNVTATRGATVPSLPSSPSPREDISVRDKSLDELDR